MEYVGPGGDGHGRVHDATPAEHLDALVARAQNGFELDDAITSRLGYAVAWSSELQSFWGAGDPQRPPERSTYRHVFLLADGGSETVWELEYTKPDEPGQWYEIYTDADALEQAQRRVNELIAGPGFSDPEFEPWPAELDLECIIGNGQTEWPRRYVEDGEGSADHARRVLRRAENHDIPDELTQRRLRGARAHDIRILPHRPTHPSGRGVWWRMYEHAFLLENGDEVVLWELEHNMTPGRRLVCEVYADEEAAERAAQRHSQPHR
ncbi:DUF6227 family protein [Streptomyces sp. RB6PN25]|uniref:DUF6227 family protein n=1 Tax=Streptomyces humicola TaxID=2953240 RepID=A0ABT1PSC0_9ACTN|nr:DUF6227 family protein [Streptomyces humicola]MCQ4080569.1 DUF6227 family protein [Streptomyces humicola]